MGLIDPNEGTVLMNNQKIDYTLTDQISFVTEERSLLTKLTVIEQLEYYGTLKDMEIDEIHEEADKWLEKFGITNYKNRKIKELSKGNQQKIQFIAAIINHPKLLILDEPFTGLDPLNVKLMKEAIYELQKEGCSIIFSSHQMEYIEDFCEQLVILVKGKAVVSGSLKQIKEDYGKKTIIIQAEDLDPKEVEKITGVEKVDIKPNELVVTIASKEIAPLVFKKIKKYNISKYVVEEPSLNEIFIEKVGSIHE